MPSETIDLKTGLVSGKEANSPLTQSTIAVTEFIQQLTNNFSNWKVSKSLYGKLEVSSLHSSSAFNSTDSVSTDSSLILVNLEIFISVQPAWVNTNGVVLKTPWEITPWYRFGRSSNFGHNLYSISATPMPFWTMMMFVFGPILSRIGCKASTVWYVFVVTTKLSIGSAKVSGHTAERVLVISVLSKSLTTVATELMDSNSATLLRERKIGITEIPGTLERWTPIKPPMEPKPRI